MKITRIGLDLAKAVFQVHGVDAHKQNRVVSGLASCLLSVLKRNAKKCTQEFEHQKIGSHAAKGWQTVPAIVQDS